MITQITGALSPTFFIALVIGLVLSLVLTLAFARKELGKMLPIAIVLAALGAVAGLTAGSAIGMGAGTLVAGIVGLLALSALYVVSGNRERGMPSMVGALAFSLALPLAFQGGAQKAGQERILAWCYAANQDSDLLLASPNDEADLEDITGLLPLELGFTLRQCRSLIRQDFDAYFDPA